MQYLYKHNTKIMCCPLTAYLYCRTEILIKSLIEPIIMFLKHWCLFLVFLVLHHATSFKVFIFRQWRNNEVFNKNRRITDVFVTTLSYRLRKTHRGSVKIVKETIVWKPKQISTLRFSVLSLLLEDITAKSIVIDFTPNWLIHFEWMFSFIFLILWIYF